MHGDGEGEGGRGREDGVRVVVVPLEELEE
jgi:hypothetical protein